MQPLDRIDYTGDIKTLLQKVCGSFDIGLLQKYSLIETGYEDCNIILETKEGKFLCKIFSKKRTPADVQRYSEIMKKVVEAGVRHPELQKTENHQVLFSHKAPALVLMRFIEGETFLELDRPPNNSERKDVLQQAAIINAIDFTPPYLFDSWAIPHIHTMFDKVKKYIQPADRLLVKQAMDRYDAIPVASLPKCFVHGDFTKANILKGNDGKIYILDFSVANRYPRIQELAVIAANLMFEKGKDGSLPSTCTSLATEYNSFLPLTKDEIEHLYPYALAGVAMEFMGAHQEKFINGNDTEETNYWMHLGRSGLKQALGK